MSEPIAGPPRPHASTMRMTTTAERRETFGVLTDVVLPVATAAAIALLIAGRPASGGDSSRVISRPAGGEAPPPPPKQS